MPALQALRLKNAELKKLIARRIFKHPSRTPVIRVRAFVQTKILPQRRKPRLLRGRMPGRETRSNRGALESVHIIHPQRCRAGRLNAEPEPQRGQRPAKEIKPQKGFFAVKLCRALEAELRRITFGLDEFGPSLVGKRPVSRG